MKLVEWCVYVWNLYFNLIMACIFCSLHPCDKWQALSHTTQIEVSDKEKGLHKARAVPSYCTTK